MKKFIEYGVKVILIVLVLLAYQSMSIYANYQVHQNYLTWWFYVSYAAMVCSYILCGMIIAYNERRSGKASVTKFVLFLIAIFLVGFPFSMSLWTAVTRNYTMLSELVRVLSITFGILLTGIKL
jgi:cation transport ATPase